MSSVHHVDSSGRVMSSLVSAGQIQRQDLFDEDYETMASSSAADVTHDVSNEDNIHIQRRMSDSSMANRCCTADLFRHTFTVILLTVVNLINYMDRFSVAGESACLL